MEVGDQGGEDVREDRHGEENEASVRIAVLGGGTVSGWLEEGVLLGRGLIGTVGGLNGRWMASHKTRPGRASERSCVCEGRGFLAGGGPLGMRHDSRIRDAFRKWRRIRKMQTPLVRGQ